MTPPALMYKSGMTSIFLSIKILSAAGVVGPLAASAMILAYVERRKEINKVQGVYKEYSSKTECT